MENENNVNEEGNINPQLSLKEAKIRDFPLKNDPEQRLKFQTLSVRAQHHDLYRKIKEMGKSGVEDITPDEFFEVLGQLTVFRLIEDNKTFLSREEVRALTKDIRDEIIDHLLEVHMWMARDTKLTKKTSETGTRIELGESEIARPKRDDESKLEYIYRLQCHEEHRRIKLTKDFFGDITKNLNFSKSLNDRLADMMGNLTTPVLPKIIKPTLPPRYVTAKEIVREPVNHTLMELKELNSNVDELNDNILQLNQNVLAMYNTTTESSRTIALMLIEMQGSKKEEQQKFMWNTVLTIFGLFFSAVASYYAYTANDASVLVPHLKDIKTSVDKSSEARKEPSTPSVITPVKVISKK